MESSSTGAKKINHKKQEKYSSGPTSPSPLMAAQSLLNSEKSMLSLPSCVWSMVRMMALVAPLMSYLVCLVNQALGLTLSHFPSNLNIGMRGIYRRIVCLTYLLYKLLELVLGDHTVTVHVKELESL